MENGSSLPHLNHQGAVHMVDISGKERTLRVARAQARLCVKPQTLTLVKDGNARKGDVLAIARIAAIQAAKRTPDLIPLAHPIRLKAVEVDIHLEDQGIITITAEVRTTGQTGVEMEALTAVTVGALTIYDMVKGVERGVTIQDVVLLEKTGGKSGDWQREK